MNQLSRALLALLTLATISSTLHAQEVTEVDRRRWIETLYKNRSQGVRLGDMTFPGTHDSGTYNITSDSDLHSSAPGIYSAAKGIVADWSKTVSDNCYQQMNAGIRYLDLRIAEHKGKLVLIHAMVGADFEECLGQVKRFMDENPREIVFLEAQRIPGGENNNRMYDLFDQYLGNRKPANNKPIADLTLDELWANDPQDGQRNTAIIMIGGNQPTTGNRGFFDNSNLTGGYANTTSVGAMLSHLQSLVVNYSDFSKMLYTTYTLTPQVSTIVGDVFNIFQSGSIRKWSDEKLRPVIGEWVPKFELLGEQANFIATDFHEYTAAVAEAIRLNTQAPAAPGGKLKIARAAGNDLVWNDRGSGGKHDGSIWTPRRTGDYYPLSHMPFSGYGNQSGADASYLVKAAQPGVVKPLGYNWIWDDRGSGANTDVSIWRPIAPRGYVCLGDVAVARHGYEPSTDLIRCVHESFTIQSAQNFWKWNDKSTGAKFDVELRDSASFDGSTVNSRPLRAFRGRGAEADQVYRSLRAAAVQIVEAPAN